MYQERCQNMTPSELARQFYDNRYEKDDVVEEWCDVCEKVTKHTAIKGHTGLESYSYWICQTCGHKE